MKVVSIEWLDAASIAGWHTKDALGLVTIRSVGWLVSEDKQKITVAASYDKQNDAYGCTVTIPKPWVKKRKVLK